MDDADFGNFGDGNGIESFNGDEIGGSPDMMTTAAQGRLLSFVERIEHMNEEIAGLTGDRKEIFSEAKGEGFDTKIIRKVIARRAMDKVKRDEEMSLIELYEAALEMVKP